LKVAVYGAGGVGGYFGARLAAAGNEVHFIARGRHLAAMREKGLLVETSAGPVRVAKPLLHEDPSTIGEVDAVLFAVKLWDVEAAAQKLKPAMREGTIVIPFQNGIESPEILKKHLGAKHVETGVAYIATSISAPGVVTQTGTMQGLQVGPGAKAFAEACKAAGINIEVSADIERARWEKFVFLVAVSSATAVARAPLGVVRADPDLRWLLEQCMQETWRLAKSRGVDLGGDFVAGRMKHVDTLHANMKASLLHDLENGGRLEAPWLCGAVARMSAEAGLDAPVNRAVFAALKPFVNGAPGKSR
jgi:2-dehydropantoate 2-reductase